MEAAGFLIATIVIIILSINSEKYKAQRKIEEKARRNFKKDTTTPLSFEEWKKQRNNEQKSAPAAKPIPNERTEKFINAYKAADILTANERNNYKTLRIAADRKGYIICPKVRLADIVNARNDEKYMSHFGRIKSKHVDFAIYDCEMRNLKVIIELDDSSHDTEERRERDEFVDFILNDCGIRIIHTRHITPDILDDV